MNETGREFSEQAALMAGLTDMIIEQIRKLGELHEEGILTEEEFAAKKAELLSRI